MSVTRMCNGSTIHTNNTTIIGNANKITGSRNTIVGNANQVTGDNNNITGNANQTKGDHNRCTGNANQLTGNDNTVTGNQNRVNGRLVVPKRAPSVQWHGGSMSVFNNYPASVIGHQPVDSRSGSVVIARGAVINGAAIGEGSMVIDMYRAESKEERKAKRRKKKDMLLVKVPGEDELIHDTEAAEDDEESCCRVCLDRVANCILAPCNHKRLCVECSRSLFYGKKRSEATCPVCNGKVKRASRVF